MLHEGFPPQTGYFWEFSDLFLLLLSGKVSFQKLCGPFFLHEGLAIWQAVCLLLSHKNKHEGSRGRKLCNSSFLSRRTRWVSRAAVESLGARCVRATAPSAAPALCVCQMRGGMELLSSCISSKGPGWRASTWSTLPPARSCTGLSETAGLMLKSCWVRALVMWFSSRWLRLRQHRYASHAYPRSHFLLAMRTCCQWLSTDVTHSLFTNPLRAWLHLRFTFILEIGAIFSLIANTAWKEFYICLFWSLL